MLCVCHHHMNVIFYVKAHPHFQPLDDNNNSFADFSGW